MDVRGTDGADTLTGGDDADRLYGYRGQDSLIGGDGNDTIFGGSRDDTMVGGNGDDTFYVDEPQYDRPGGHSRPTPDRVVELDGGGIDTIVLSKTITSYNLGYSADLANVENLVLRDDGDADGDGVLDHWVFGEGNAAGNAIYGTAARNGLQGDAGDDHLVGKGGDDRLEGGDGKDTLEGGSGVDVMIGGDNADQLISQGDGDLMDGGLGADTFLFTHLGGHTLATITDLNGSAGDTIDITALHATRVDAFDGQNRLEVVVEFNGRNHDHVVIAFDEDGDKAADYLIKTDGQNATFDGLVT